MPRSFVVVLFFWTIACGGATGTALPAGEGGTDTEGDAASMDGTGTAYQGEGGTDSANDQAAGDAASTDGGEFACGDALCAPSQICLYPPYGCVALKLPDSGVCPEGTEYLDASGSCLPPPPPPSCVSPAPGEGSFDCSGQDAGASCTVVSAPIPSGCSHICRAICV